MLYGFYDWTYVLIIIGALLSMGASAMVNTTFSRYSGVGNSRGISGAETAQSLMRSAGLLIPITHISGNLTDHYDPSQKSLSLSDPVYGSTSVAAVAVAAHECGHAMQDAENYSPLRIRSAIVPVVNFGAKLSWPLIFLGIILNGSISLWLLYAGTILFCLVVAFQLVTLPVEFDASARALRMLENQGILADSEMDGAKKVLRAAALTYVAGVASSLLQLLRLLLIINGRRRND